MIEHVHWERTTYNVLPYKFEAGTPDFNGSFAFAAALDYLQSIGMERVEQYEHELMEELLRAMHAIDLNGCTLKIYAESLPKSGVLSFNVYNRKNELIHPFDVGVLLDRQGVAIRTGHHCAEPLIDALGVPGTIRVSFGLYNDSNDISVFASALEKSLAMLG